MSVKIIYKDLAVGAAEDFEISAFGAASYSNLENLRDEDTVNESYANCCELYSVLLDDNRPLFPDNPDGGNVVFGLVSSAVSDSNGEFAQIPVLTCISDEYYTSAGITLSFDPGTWATEVLIDWYRDDAVLSSEAYYPDSSSYFCENKIENYNKVVIEFHSICMPENRLFLRSFQHGRSVTFFGDELESVSITQEVSSISAELSIDTCDFTLRPKGGAQYLFLEKQSVEIYNNDVLRMVGFIDSADRSARGKYDIEASDYIGILSKSTFPGGMYKNKNVGVLAGEIIGAAEINIPYTIEESIASKTVSGYLPMTDCRECLLQVLFAVMAAASTSCFDGIKIFELPDTVSKSIPLAKVYTDPDIEIAERVSDLNLYIYDYIQSTESISLYEAAQSGAGNGLLVVFSEPVHSLQISGGEILESGTNFARINAGNNCVLSGQKYTKTQSILTKRAEIWSAGRARVVKNIDSSTLSCDPGTLIEQLFDYFNSRTNIINASVASDFLPGDMITIETVEGSYSGNIESMKYKLTGGTFIKSEVRIR